ncbi:MAG: PAS domain-containing protein [Alphaproteobacteria bacterium]|nr:PAS domain-containing protein [Alphaproteobacteria bacterium]
MARSTTLVASEGGRLVRMLARWGIVLALAVAVIPSAAYMLIAVDHAGEDFAGALDRRAAAVSKMVYANTGLWRFEGHRIRDILEPLRSDPGRSAYLLEARVGDAWETVVEAGEPPRWPTLARQVEILDGAVVVGRLTGIHNITHVVDDVLLVTIASCILGVSVFLLIRLQAVPFLRRSLERLAAHEAELARHRAQLESEVAERTRVLTETNARLQDSLAEVETRQRENEKLAAIAQQVDSGIVIMDPRGAIEWVNPGFTAMTGYSLAEAAGKTAARLLNGPDTDPGTVQAMREAFHRGQAFAVEILHYTKSGAAKWVDLTSTMLHDERGTVQRCIAIGRDVTERKRQERRLAEALEREREINQQQRRFVSIVSHEFRTPLTIIDGAAQRLARNAEHAGPADIRERVDKIRRAVARMGELIETTLNAARVDSGALDVKAGAVDLKAMAATIADRIRGIATDFDIALDLCDDPAVVLGDPRLLDQVLNNLLMNAVKYSGDSRRIEMAVAAEAGLAVVSIRDHGIGIPADELPKLFTRFYRASTARNLPGTGIGLNLARDLVAMHEGEITVSSEVGRGSTFAVRLPLAPVVEARAPVQAA